MTVASTQGGELQLGAKATGSCSAALDQHQMGTDTERGQSLALGTCRLALVAGYQEQDWSAICGAGIKGADAPNLLKTCRGLRAPGLSHSRSARGFLPRLSRRPVRRSSHRIGHHSPAARHCAERGAFIRVNRPDCTPPVRQSLPNQQLVKCLADRRHVSNLSSSVAFAGFNTSEAANGRAQNSVGAFQKRQGGYPHVGS